MIIKRLALILLTVGIPISAFLLNVDRARAINLTRTSPIERDFILRQLQLIKQKQIEAFNRLEDVDIVSRSLGFAELKGLNTDIEKKYGALLAYRDREQYQYQYQLETGLSSSTIETSVVVANIANAFSQLDFSQTQSNSQVQILTQASFETIDEDVYYYEGELIEQSTVASEEGIVSTILSAPKSGILSFRNLGVVKASESVSESLLGSSLNSSLSFFSGIQKLKQNSVALQNGEIDLGPINSIPSVTTSRIERSKYQMQLDEQNQEYLEEQADRQEELRERLEDEREKREEAKQKAAEEKQEQLNDAREKRQDELDKWRESKQKLESNRNKQSQNFLRNR